MSANSPEPADFEENTTPTVVPLNPAETAKPDPAADLARNSIHAKGKSFHNQRAQFRVKESQRAYHSLVQKFYQFLIPPSSRVLEIGCGTGDLLASVQPSRGVGIDYSSEMVKLAQERHPDLEFATTEATDFKTEEKFDYVILSDLVNDSPDVQSLLESVQKHSYQHTRIVINFFNNLWRPILSTAEKLGLKAPTVTQNWLSKSDVENLLHLAGWELIKSDTRMLCPVRIPIVAKVLNQWVAPMLSHFCLSTFLVARPRPLPTYYREYTCSVVIPARNEAGNIEDAVKRVPNMGLGTEIIFIEGHSKDNTWEEIQRVKAAYPDLDIKCMQQTTKGKGGAVREAFAVATGQILFILDADLTMPPEDLPKFYHIARAGTADFVNGVRLVYPMENEAMRFLNMLGNKFFSMAFSWLLGQQIKDTLCGTKVLFKKQYDIIAANRNYFGDFDPFGDFDLLFGAAKLNHRIIDLPIRYRARTYGDTNISRWSHGFLLLRMVAFAATRLKFLK